MRRLAFALGMLAVVTPAMAEAWTVESKVSPMDDSVSVTLTNEASAILAGGAATSFLFVGCLSNKTNFAVRVPDTHFGSMSDLLLTYRIDDQPPEKVMGTGSSEYVLVRAGSIPILKAMMQAQRFRIEASSVRSHAIVEFDVSGLAEVIPPLREACHW